MSVILHPPVKLKIVGLPPPKVAEETSQVTAPKKRTRARKPKVKPEANVQQNEILQAGPEVHTTPAAAAIQQPSVEVKSVQPAISISTKESQEDSLEKLMRDRFADCDLTMYE